MDGQVAGQQREFCDKFVTHVTELSQKKVLAKCLKPQVVCRRRQGPGERARPRAQSHAPRGAFEKMRPQAVAGADPIPGKIARMDFLQPPTERIFTNGERQRHRIPG